MEVDEKLIQLQMNFVYVEGTGFNLFSSSAPIFHQVRLRDITSDIFITNLSASAELLFMLFEIRNTRIRIRIYSLCRRGELRCT